jgi:hypothetical protein
VPAETPMPLPLVAADEQSYMVSMSLYLSRFARYAARRLVSDPRARETAVNAARSVAEEARLVVRDEDPARAAGRAVRRAYNKWQAPSEGSQDRLPGPREDSEKQ